MLTGWLNVSPGTLTGHVHCALIVYHGRGAERLRQRYWTPHYLEVLYLVVLWEWTGFNETPTE